MKLFKGEYKILKHLFKVDFDKFDILELVFENDNKKELLANLNHVYDNSGIKQKMTKEDFEILSESDIEEKKKEIEEGVLVHDGIISGLISDIENNCEVRLCLDRNKNKNQTYLESDDSQYKITKQQYLEYFKIFYK